MPSLRLYLSNEHLSKSSGYPLSTRKWPLCTGEGTTNRVRVRERTSGAMRQTCAAMRTITLSAFAVTVGLPGTTRRSVAGYWASEHYQPAATATAADRVLWSLSYLQLCTRSLISNHCPLILAFGPIFRHTNCHFTRISVAASYISQFNSPDWDKWMAAQKKKQQKAEQTE